MATTVKNKTTTADGFCVYIGPTIRGVVQYGDIFPDGVKAARKKLAPAIEKYPGIALLLVPGEELPQARIKVKTPGNALFVTARELRKALN